MKWNLILKIYFFVTIIPFSFFSYALFDIFVVDKVRKIEPCAEKTTNKKDFIYCIENGYLSDRHGIMNYLPNPI
mgnify:FL=1